MPFEKGREKTGGRQVGTKNRNWVDPNFWTEQLYETIKDFPEEKKAEKIFQYLTMLFSKMNAIPITQADSLRNAEQAAEVLKSIEAPADKNEINA